MRNRSSLLFLLAGLSPALLAVFLVVARPPVARGSTMAPVALSRAPGDSALSTPGPQAQCQDSFEPNDGFDSAWTLSPGSIESLICCIDQGVDQDYYRFQADAGDGLAVTLYDLPHNYDICLYDLDRKLLGCSTNAGTSKESIEVTAAKSGFHYIWIYGVQFDCDSSLPYGLDIKKDPPEATPTFTPTPTHTPTDTPTPTPSPTRAGPEDPLEMASSLGSATVDGSLGWFEWQLAERFEFEHGFISVLNDAVRLYILVDVLADDVADPRTPSSPGDWFWLSFDTNEDGDITPDVDLNYALETGTYDLRYQYYSGPGSLESLEPGPILSSVATSFDCFYADGTEWHWSEGLADVCDMHRIWEFAIDLGEIDAVAEAGEIVRMGLRVSSETPGFEDDLPEDFHLDFGDLFEIWLAPHHETIPTEPRGGGIGLREDPQAIEITQAIQDRANSLPLVQDKTTVARVYVQTVGIPGPMPSIVYLYGSRDGAELPGSPLAMLHPAPSSLDRERLHDTANFILPVPWVSGTVTFRARALNLEGDEAWTSLDSTVTFEPKEAPIYWLVPVNMGTEEHPVTVAHWRLDRPMTYLETVYPIPEVQWVFRDWWLIDAVGHPEMADCPDGPACPEGEIIGSIIHYDILQPLQELYEALELAHSASGVAGLWDPEGAYYPFPDEIIGVVQSGGDSGGAGHVSVIDTREHGIAHEVNHNLDRRPETERTWGRHVCNPTPDADYDTRWGCDAQLCDPDWQPYMCTALTRCTDGIAEVGFDTRLPWWDGSDHEALNCRFTALQGERREEPIGGYVWRLTGWPDFMSYCNAAAFQPDGDFCSWTRPRRWISPYRWEALFNNAFPTITTAGQAGSATPQQPQSVAYTSGQVNDDGTGSLDPVFVQPGHPSEGVAPGDYTLEVQDMNSTLLVLPFEIAFEYTEIEEESPLELDRVPFAFQLPEQVGATSILLKKGTQVLDTIAVSDHAPAVTVLEPDGGEQWSTRHTIRWQASDQDGDALTFIVLYSPDDGNSWLPIAHDVQGRSYDVDTGTIPGSEESLIRVIASDGYHTSQDDSDVAFSVAGKAPVANIVEPEQETRFQIGDVVRLRGTGFDVDDGLLSGDSLVWSHRSAIVGTGQQLDAHLPPGIHTVTLTAIDSDGQSGTVSVLIYVGYRTYLPVVSRSG